MSPRLPEGEPAGRKSRSRLIPTPSISPAWARCAQPARVSLGMQSASPRVLATLERTHTPGAAIAAAPAAREAGFAHVSVDLIYGTPGASG